jgi:aromatic ring-opening dioxygenase catalytic subunit (LigB family)
MTTRLPTYFVSHGGGPWPWMKDQYGGAYDKLEASLVDMKRQAGARPKAVLVVTSHWETDAFTVSSGAAPGMIYDYGGFPPHTYQIQYPAPGDPQLASRVAGLLDAAGQPAALDPERGLDHGTFSMLYPVYPDADMPVVQLSIRHGYDPAVHLAAGRALAPLRDEGVLILGSGDVVHNLRAAVRAENAAPLDWAQHFHDAVRGRLSAGDHAALVDPGGLGPEARMAVDEHYLPLLYVLGASEPGEPVALFNDHIDLGSISMLGARIG